MRLSPVWGESNTVNVSCDSGGWYPEPRLQWRDSRGNVLTAETPLQYSRDSSGLVSVHSWFLVSGSSEVSCSVALDGGEPKEASVALRDPTLPGEKSAGRYCDVQVSASHRRAQHSEQDFLRHAESSAGSGAAAGGWVAFGLLLLAGVLAALGFLLFRMRGNHFSAQCMFSLCVQTEMTVFF